MAARDYVLNNFGWKLASVVAAILIWMTINSNLENPETHSSSTLSRHLPVMVKKAPWDVRGFVLTPAEAEVTIRAEERARSFRKKVIVRTPPNVAVTKVEPEEVAVERVSPAESTNDHRNPN
ncbi:MAG: hypothetical protein DME22_11625 [Verrucomicrobia bacterium]|nr:MAG: hypothetical protein DME22_11625 [Verrucomicrobiota bacterium]